MNFLVENDFTNCEKRYLSKDTLQRTFTGIGFDFKDKQFMWKYSDYHSDQCVPQNFDYSHLVTTQSTTGIILFLFKLIKVLLTVGGIYLLHQILSSTLTEHPFINKNSTRLRWIAYLLIGYTFLDWFYRDIIKDVIKNFYFSATCESYYIGITEKISFTLLLIGFLVLIISSVFKYGYELKAENDLTI